MVIYMYIYTMHTNLFLLHLRERAGPGVLGPLPPCAEAPAELRGSAADRLRGPGAGRAGGLCHWARDPPVFTTEKPRVNHPKCNFDLQKMRVLPAQMLVDHGFLR